MLRSTKIVYRPELIETRMNQPKQLGIFLFTLYFGLMCNLECNLDSFSMFKKCRNVIIIDWANIINKIHDNIYNYNIIFKLFII